MPDNCTISASEHVLRDRLMSRPEAGPSAAWEDRVAVGNDQHRAERRPRLETIFGAQHVEAALDLLTMADMAWHDCYGPRELEIPPEVLEDILLLCHGELSRLMRVALAAVTDFRDVRMAADEARAGQAR